MKVEFHSGVIDKLGSACRFLRQAHQAGAGVTVCADAPTLERLDLALWSAEPLSFVPHVRQYPGREPATGVLERTSIRLVERIEAAAAGSVLLNLGPELVEHWDHYERVVEIVSNEAVDAAAGRRRWRHYVECTGIELVHKSRQTAQ